VILAIDFDGVIHDYKHPVLGRTMGMPLEGARTALEAFKAAGHTIVVFTVRDGEPYVHDWMHYYGIPYDSITRIKGDFDLIIDDRAVNFTSWEDFNAI
jgi:hypothetical protein